MRKQLPTSSLDRAIRCIFEGFGFSMIVAVLIYGISALTLRLSPQMRREKVAYHAALLALLLATPIFFWLLKKFPRRWSTRLPPSARAIALAFFLLAFLFLTNLKVGYVYFRAFEPWMIGLVLFFLFASLTELCRTALVALFAGVVGFIATVHLQPFFLAPKRTLGIGWDSVDFNAVFHSVVHAYLGKISLVDYSAQYGMYSMLLAPLFWVVGLSDASFNAITGLMNAAIFAGFFWALRRWFKNRIVHTLMALGCTQLLFFFVGYIYLANLPIRYFFVSIGLYFVLRYLERRHRRDYFSVFAICTIAVFWNLDTGAVFFLSWLALLAMDSWLNPNGTEKRVNAIARHGCVGLAGLVLVAALYAGYAWIHTGVLPTVFDFIRFQILYFGQGIAMDTPPRNGPWVLLLLMYCFSWILGLRQMAFGGSVHQRNFGGVLFFLSILGVGLFSYYIAHSHERVLSVVAWPAWILFGLWLDTLLTAARTEPVLKIVSVPMAGFACFFASLAVAHATGPWRGRPNHPNQYSAKYDRDRQFVRGLDLHHHPTLVLSDKSGLFYLDAKTTSPLPIPGATETYIPNDLRMIETFLSEGRGPTRVLVDTECILYSRKMYDPVREILRSKFRVIAQNQERTLTLHERIPAL